MRTADSFFSSVLQDNPAYRLSGICIAFVLAGVLAYLLLRKLKEMNIVDGITDIDNEEEFAISEAALIQAFPPHLRPVFAKTSGGTSALVAEPQQTEEVKPIVTVFESAKPAPQLARPIPQPAGNSTASATVMPAKTTVNETAADSQINAILSSLTDLIFEFNEEKVCLNVWYNKSRTLMIDLDGFVGKTVTENIGAENATEMNNALDTVIRTHISTQVEFLSFYGSGRWFLAKFNPVFDADGRYTGRITASVSDISEQKQYSAQLREKQQQLIEAQKIARIGNWWYDLRTRETYWSENLFSLLDTTALPGGLNHFEYYARLVHPEDRRTVYQYFANIATSALNELEHRITTPAGHTKYFNIMRGDPVRDEHGEIVRVTGIIKDVTESRKAERIIKKSQAELLEAQTIAKIGNWKWYIDQKFLTWSDEVYHIHEVQPMQQAQRGISHFKLLLKHVHPNDKVILLDFLKDPANLRRTSYEYRIITPTGYIKHLSIIIGKVRYNENGTVRNVVGTLQDITDRKTAELNIQQTEDNYKQVLERIKLAALTLDGEGRIVFCNKHLAALLGYTQQSLIGLPFFKHFVPNELKGMFTEWYSKNHFRTNNINAILCAGGRQRIISWQNTVIYDDAGRIKQVTSIGEDITDQQKDRENLIFAKEEAERSSSFKSEFLSIMSHEIRTPMNAVIGTTNLLLEESPRADQLPYLNNLKFSGESLLSIIDEILDYNKIEAGKLELTKKPLNIHQLVANIRQLFHARASEKKIGLFTDIDANIPISLLGDQVRLGQILSNLLSNAIKFTTQGNVTIKVKEKRRTDKHLLIDFTIADTGKGIAPENLERIFEPFVQETHGGNYGGSGLGLAIVKRLVGLHNAEIKATSVLGQGTQFNFSIDFDYVLERQIVVPVDDDPIAVAPKITADEHKPNNIENNGHYVNGNSTVNNGVKHRNSHGTISSAHNGSTGQSRPALYSDLDGMTVLVVDDNKMNILIANRFLHKWKITTHEATDGANAVEMVSNNSYDLVIMDLQMPIMDGFQATKMIKETHPTLPVIALTADAMPETFVKARNAGIDDYMTKPFMPEILFEKVAKHYHRN